MLLHALGLRCRLWLVNFLGMLFQLLYLFFQNFFRFLSLLFMRLLNYGFNRFLFFLCCGLCFFLFGFFLLRFLFQLFSLLCGLFLFLLLPLCICWQLGQFHLHSAFVILDSIDLDMMRGILYSVVPYHFIGVLSDLYVLGLHMPLYESPQGIHCLSCPFIARNLQELPSKRNIVSAFKHILRF